MSFNWVADAEFTDVEVPTAPAHVDIPYITFFPTPTENSYSTEDFLQYVERRQREEAYPEGRDTYRFWRWLDPRDRIDSPAPLMTNLPVQFPHYNFPEGHPGTWRFRQDQWMQDTPVIGQDDLWDDSVSIRMAYTLNKLLTNTKSDEEGRPGRCAAAITEKDLDAGIFHYQVGCREKRSKRGGHTVKFKFLIKEDEGPDEELDRLENELEEFEIQLEELEESDLPDNKKLRQKRDLERKTRELERKIRNLERKKKSFAWSKFDVLVYCTCPAWRYWGSQYNSESLGYAYEDGYEGDKSRAPAPKKDIPTRRSNLLCKHAIKAAGSFLNYERIFVREREKAK